MENGPNPAPEQPDQRDSVRTVLFIDLASYTPLTEAMGDEAAVEVVSRFAGIVRELARHHGGQVVKQIGDEFMLVFAEATAAVRFGIAARDRAHAEPNFPGVRIGVHRGPVLHHEDDYYGATVNLAARIASESNRWEILITSAVRDELAAGAAGEAEVRPVGKRSLKGITGEVQMFEVEPGSHSTRPLDPVCGMALDASTSPVVVDWKGRAHRFCSERCRDLFLASPETYGA